MNRPYQFYYFVPLVSFWLVVLYTTLACPPSVTAASLQDNNASTTQADMSHVMPSDIYHLNLHKYKTNQFIPF